jgi:hypothetical protein
MTMQKKAEKYVRDYFQTVIYFLGFFFDFFGIFWRVA